ncbi:MAG: hypothetical protein DRP54_07365 [Spirochaetes bacterium]|nr:MAG: hypothetical protein DRP54_07365 [Spirochaetota bacterium]
MKLLLLSGNPYNPNLSFYHQFKELSTALNNYRIETTIAFPSRKSKTKLSENLKQFNAIIALGYPDQFKINRYLDIPFFLWTQVSKPPDVSGFDNLIAVPLTRTTEVFLLTAGVKNLEKVIPHGVNTDIFRPDNKKRLSTRKELGLGNKMVIGFAGNNSHRKRYDVLLETFSYITQKIHDSVLLIKTDKKSTEEGFNIPGLIDKYNLRNSVKIIEGSVSIERMVCIYNAMDIYLHLSEWEGFGIPVIEAGACGVPVITHPIQGPYELIPYPHILHIEGKYINEDGTLLRYAEPQSAAKTVLSLVKTPNKLKALSFSMREHVLHNFSINLIAKKWLELLNRYPV